MNFCFIILIINSISLCLSSSSIMVMGEEISLSKHGCPQKCGDISIPYPFGIGPNCSFNSSFQVDCRNESKPFLIATGLEAIQFFLNENTVRIVQDVSILKCSSTKGEFNLGQPLLDTPFTLGAAINRVVLVGCRSQISLSNPTGGCTPTCGYITHGCFGINCCSVIVPPMSQRLRLDYAVSNNNNNNDSVCGYVFLADYRWLTTDYDQYTGFQNSSLPLEIEQLKTVPLLLEWRLDYMVGENLQGIVCENRSVEAHTFDDNVYAFNTTRCRCDHGFEGNPYLGRGGCAEIDECGNSTLNNCGVGTVCVNTDGGFMCRDRTSKLKSIIVGVGSALGALLLLGVIWIMFALIRKRIRANRKRRFFKRNGGLLLEQRLCSGDGGFEKIKLFEEKELGRATDGYDEGRVLGRGGQGTVYKGMLRSGRIVAVKKLKRMDEGDVEGFVNEVVIMSQINHRNVAKLLGCCLETEVPLLVYVFVPNGTLFEHIHHRNSEEFLPLSWKMRVRIAAQVAGALSYLHNAASSPIYHRDIKSTNILLDDKYGAKVSDFGISRSVGIDQTHLSTRVLGTFGYLDPQYFWSSKFTEKSDVYSFGVVVVEILTGEKAISDAGVESGRNLAADFLQSMEEDHLFEMLDPEVVEGGVDEIVIMADLARRCLHPRGSKRPTMKEVAVELEGIRMVEEASALPSNYHHGKDFQSIDFGEDCDFSSISDDTILTVFNADSSSEFPLSCGS